jgi:parallel beta-helix repeat protein
VPQLEACEPRVLLAGGTVSALSINNVSLSEGSAGNTQANFTVTLTPPDLQHTVTVDYTTVDGSATVANHDYQAVSGTLTFPPDATSEPIAVPILADLRYDIDRTFTVVLSNPTNATISNGVGTGTIHNDNSPPGLSAQDVSVSGTTSAVFTVTLASVSELTTTVDYGTADGTATAAHHDYQPTSGTLTFAPGQTSQQVTVPVSPATTYGPDKTFTLDLSRPTNATLTRAVATATLVNTVAEPSLSIGDTAVNRGPTATVATFTVDLSAPSQFATTVAYASADGTATVGGQDYEPVSGTLTLAPGQTSGNLTVPVPATDVVAPDKTFTVNLSNPGHATLARATGTATLHDVNVGGQIGFSASLYNIDASGTQVIVTVTRTGGQAAGVSVHYGTSDGTAVAGTDYVSTNGTLTFGLGQVSQTFAIPLIPDLSIGPPKTFFLSLDSPGGGGALASQTTAAIVLQRHGSLVVVNTNNEGPGSLRQAILTADATPGADAIVFAIRGTGPFLISPTSPLPPLNGPTRLDATTQPGYAGRPIVALLGGAAGPNANGLVLAPGSGGSSIQGLAIGGFSGSGIVVGSNRDAIEGDYLGVDPSGGLGVPNGDDGITVVNATGTSIGGLTAASADLVSGNGGVGVRIVGAGSSGNVIAGDRIGTNRDGTAAIGNAQGGIFLDGAPGTTIGLNQVSGNAGPGIVISGASAAGNLIFGNRIGTDATGTAALGNGNDGVFIAGAPNNTIGGTTPGAGNVISGNGWTGIRLEGATASGNIVEGNHVGTDASGDPPLGNKYDGIYINEAPANTIGGTTAGAGNLISGNGQVGVQLEGGGASANVLEGNLIGTNVTGLAALPNGADGVFVNQAPNNSIGGRAPGAGNLISGNTSVGIQIFGAGSTGNVLDGNHIGTNVNGVPNLGNNFGVFLNQAGANTIGADNDIAGNRTLDVRVVGGGGSTIGVPFIVHAARRGRVPMHHVRSGHKTPRGPKVHGRRTHKP